MSDVMHVSAHGNRRQTAEVPELTPAQLRSIRAVLETGHTKLAARQLDLSAATVVNHVRDAQLRLKLPQRLLVLFHVDRILQAQARGARP